MTDAGKLWELYSNEKAAYRRYVALMSGELLIRGQRVSPRRVVDARRVWLESLEALRSVATGAEILDMLQRNLTEGSHDA